MEIERGEYLLAALMDLGPTRPTGWGLRAVDWPEITAFAQGTGRVAEAWEMEALRKMALGYAAGLANGADPLAIMPSERQSDDGKRSVQ